MYHAVDPEQRIVARKNAMPDNKQHSEFCKFEVPMVQHHFNGRNPANYLDASRCGGLCNEISIPRAQSLAHAGTPMRTYDTEPLGTIDASIELPCANIPVHILVNDADSE